MYPGAKPHFSVLAPGLRTRNLVCSEEGRGGKRRGEEKKEEEKRGEEMKGERGWSLLSASQGTSRIAGGHQE